MDLTDDERNLLLAGLYVLRITSAADGDEVRETIEKLALRLGGDPAVTYFRPSS